MDESKILFIKNRSNTKKSEEKLVVDDENVTIQSRTGGAITVNFTGSEPELKDIEKFFTGIDEVEPLELNIAGAGDVDHYFRGISDIVPNDNNGLYNLSVTLQMLTTTI